MVAVTTGPIGSGPEVGATPASKAPALKPAAGPQGGSARSTERSGRSVDFRAVLNQVQAEMGGLRLSAHARTRLAGRGIELTGTQIQRLVDAVNRAGAKGAREAVIILEGTAFVVSVRNRTVITVVDGPRLKENIFTNVDTVVFA